jgi:Protein of unknown function (DUF559)
MAAVLALGPTAVLSHRAAAEQLGLLAPKHGRIDVTVPGTARRSRRAIRVHGGTLHPAEITRHQGIPLTSVARTLLDIAETERRRVVERACDQAEVLGLFDLRATCAVLRRANGRRGAPLLRAMLDEHRVGETLTRSELEERFLALCRSSGIPRPRVNAWIALEPDGLEVDFLWPAERLVVEVDGWASHRTRRRFESDRERDQRLQIAGWQPMRFTWRQLEQDADGCARTVRAVLVKRRALVSYGAKNGSDM